MTKVGEDAFDFSYSIWPLIEVPQPVEFAPGRFRYYYLWPVGGSGTQITGDFGLVTDYWGIEHDGAYRTEYAFGAAFHFQQAPHEPWSVFASGDLLTVTDGQSNEYAGTWSGTATIWGAVPQFVGETTTWAVTPEPPAWILLGLGLLPVFKFRRRHSS
jgi:hypothetical protein